MDRRQALVAGGLMMAGAWMAETATPRRLLSQTLPMPALKHLLPGAGSPWSVDQSGPPLLVPADVKAVLDKLYTQTLTQVYSRRGFAPVMLAMAYGGDQSDATKAHRPEVCYPAQGFSIGSSQRVVLELGSQASVCRLPTRRLVARLQGRHEPLSYWICVGRQIATDGMEQKMAQMRYGFMGVVPDGLLVRVSTIDRDAERSWNTQRQFLSDWFEQADQAARERVFACGGSGVQRQGWRNDGQRSG